MIMDRINRSFRLVGQSYRLLMQDKELMVLPLVSGAIVAVVVVSFFFSLNFDLADAAQNDRMWIFAPAFLLYFVTYAIGIFFQAAVVAGATERLRGGDPSISSALSAAARRLGPILIWALIAATVGVILRAVRDRNEFIGRLAASLLGAAWSLATFFVVPIIVLEDMSIGQSISRSFDVFKRTWGETVVGSASVGIVAFFCWIGLFGVVALLAMAHLAAVAVIIAVLGGILLMVFFSALQGVYVASLYRYAVEGQTTGGLDPDLLQGAFVSKRGF
jgi:hypothetical protein